MGSAEPLGQSCRRHAIQFLPRPHPAARAPLEMLLPRALPHPLTRHMHISNQSLCFGHPSTPEGMVTRVLQDQTEGAFPYIRDLGSPEDCPLAHRSLVCVRWQYTGWRQVGDSVRKSRVFNRKVPAVAEGRAPGCCFPAVYAVCERACACVFVCLE